MSFGSDSFTLFPTSSILVGTRRNPAASIEAQQVVKLVRNPIVYSDTFTTAPTAGEIVLTKLQDGSASQNETYELTVGPRVLGGSYALAFGANSTTAIQLFTTAVSVQAAISSGINTITSNCSVADNGKLGYIISFTGRFALTNITTALTLDSTGVNFIPFQQTTLTINTAEVEDAFADSGESTITPTLEIELTQGGTPKTIFQGNVTLRKDLITAGSSVPGARDSYYTKTETNSNFVSKSSPQSNTNVVSGLINVGLFASSATYGVLPQSTETINVTTSLNFGSVPNNSSTSITISVSGASLNDIVLLGLPDGLTEGLSFLGHVVATDQIHVDAINATNSSRTQNAATFRITVIGY
jgi:hypothetical protein